MLDVVAALGAPGRLNPLELGAGVLGALGATAAAGALGLLCESRLELGALGRVNPLLELGVLGVLGRLKPLLELGLLVDRLELELLELLELL